MFCFFMIQTPNLLLTVIPVLIDDSVMDPFAVEEEEAEIFLLIELLFAWRSTLLRVLLPVLLLLLLLLF